MRLERLAMKHCQSLVFFGVALFLNACASPGTGKIEALTQDAAAQLIVAGKTTKSEIERALGRAEVAQFASGEEVWVYRDSNDALRLAKLIPAVSHIVIASDASEVNELKIAFGPNGVVKKFQLRKLAIPLNN
jgi:hypothetical protein